MLCGHVVIIFRGGIIMSDPKNENVPRPLIVYGNEYDFWLNEVDDVYDEKYGED